jgi:hypothetical protein
MAVAALEERMRLAVIEAKKVRVKVECNEERSCSQRAKIRRRSERWIREEAERERESKLLEHNRLDGKWLLLLKVCWRIAATEVGRHGEVA